MTCAHCGGELVDGAKFCPHCGERLWADAQPHDRLRVLLEQALGTHYRVVRELGRGGMGIVYLAHERGLGIHHSLPYRRQPAGVVTLSRLGPGMEKLREMPMHPVALPFEFIRERLEVGEAARESQLHL